MKPQNSRESSFITRPEKTARNSQAKAWLLHIKKNTLKLEKSSQIMKPSLSQQTFFGHFQRRDGENKIGFKSDISKKLRMQKKKKIQRKTNSRNRDNNAYPLRDDVHVNCTHSISFYINLFLSFQLTMTLQKLWEQFLESLLLLRQQFSQGSTEGGKKGKNGMLKWH